MKEKPMSFTDHLAELRSRLLRSVLVIAVFFFGAYAFHAEMFRIVAQPVLAALRGHGIYDLQALHVTETITVYIQVSLVVAVILAAPFIFYQIWAFVAPGLYSNEKRWVFPIVFLTSLFFMLGVVFCYFVFLPMVVDFLVGFTVESGDITLLPTMQKTFGFTAMFPLIFGILFQLPLLMLFMSMLGVIDYRKFLKFGRYFIVLSFAIGAIFTPPDPLSQGLMSIPICLLYFVGVGFARVGSALRKGGSSSVLPKVVGGVIVVAFALLVATASYLWGMSGGPPCLAAVVPAGTQFVLKADPASRMGSAALNAAGVPDALFDDGDPPGSMALVVGERGETWLAVDHGFPCQDPSVFVGGLCRVHGPALADGPEGSPTSGYEALGSEDGPLVLVAGPQCLDVLVPPGRGTAGSGRMVVSARTAMGGLTTVTLEFVVPSNEEPGPLAEWLVSVRDAWEPGHIPTSLKQSPLGSALAWSGGDLDIEIDNERVTASMTTTPSRGRRILGELVRGMMGRCHVRPE